jgi:orotate phosphoribosyltransferase
MTDAEQQLLALLRERCYQEGDFTLSSGAKSDYYFDAKSLFLSSVGARLIGEVLYERTRDLDVQGIGGIEIGAVPLTTAAVYAYHAHNRTMEGFFVRNQAKRHGTKKIIEGHLRAGSKVAIVDDVATSGRSIMKAVEAVRKAECTPLLVTVLVDRLEGAGNLFAKAGIPFKPIFTIKDFQLPKR